MGKGGIPRSGGLIIDIARGGRIAKKPLDSRSFSTAPKAAPKLREWMM